jgi:hypothetical protein
MERLKLSTGLLKNFGWKLLKKISAAIARNEVYESISAAC